MKKIPMRKCLATQELCPKKELIRVVKSKTGEVFIDPTGKANGRGAYLKKEAAAIEKAKKSRCLERALSVGIPERLYEELYELIGEKKN